MTKNGCSSNRHARSDPRLVRGEDLCDLSTERGNLLLDYIPHEIEVYAEVVMNQSITHAGHRAPCDLGMRLAQFGRHLLCGFTDNLEAPHAGSLKGRIFQECLATHPSGSEFQVGRFVCNVT